MALITTIKGSASDSYVTLAEANTYFSDFKPKFNSTWTGLSSDGVRESYLRESTSALDTFSNWKGFKADDNQQLEFPRTLEYLSYYKANEYPTDEIHRRIKHSQFELAMILVIRLDDNNEIENRYQEELNALSGTAQIKYRKRYDHVTTEGISGASVKRVNMLMAPWLARTKLRRN